MFPFFKLFGILTSCGDSSASSQVDDLIFEVGATESDPEITASPDRTVTAVGMDTNATLMDSRIVHLNRPFVYMLIDCEQNQPVFIGALERLEP